MGFELTFDPILSQDEMTQLALQTDSKWQDQLTPKNVSSAFDQTWLRQLAAQKTLCLRTPYQSIFLGILRGIEIGSVVFDTIFLAANLIPLGASVSWVTWIYLSTGLLGITLITVGLLMYYFHSYYKQIKAQNDYLTALEVQYALLQHALGDATSSPDQPDVLTASLHAVNAASVPSDSVPALSPLQRTRYQPQMFTARDKTLQLGRSARMSFGFSITLFATYGFNVYAVLPSLGMGGVVTALTGPVGLALTGLVLLGFTAFLTYQLYQTEKKRDMQNRRIEFLKHENAVLLGRAQHTLQSTPKQDVSTQPSLTHSNW